MKKALIIGLITTAISYLTLWIHPIVTAGFILFVIISILVLILNGNSSNKRISFIKLSIKTNDEEGMKKLEGALYQLRYHTIKEIKFVDSPVKDSFKDIFIFYFCEED